MNKTREGRGVQASGTSIGGKEKGYRHSRSDEQGKEDKLPFVSGPGKNGEGGGGGGERGYKTRP